MHYTKIKTNNKNGYVWRCVIEGPADPVTGKRTQIARRGETQKEARQRAEEALYEKELLLSTGKTSKNNKTTFENVAKEWIEIYKRKNIKISTVRIRNKEIKILNRYIAAAPIKNITKTQYQKIILDLDNKGYSRSSIEGVHTTAHMIFEYAEENGYVIKNPTHKIVLPAKKISVDDIELGIEEKYLEHDEIREFFEVVNKVGLELDEEIFKTLYYTGMRVGEMLALKETDIENNTIRITKTLYNETNNMKEYQLLTPKTKGSIRNVQIDDVLNELLLKRIKENSQIKEFALSNDVEYHDAGFIFCRANGLPLLAKTVNNRLARLLKYTKVTKKVTSHHFRHTHITLLVEAGVDVNTIMQRVGHDDIKTTMKIYTHITEKMKKDAVDKISSHLNNIFLDR